MLTLSVPAAISKSNLTDPSAAGLMSKVSLSFRASDWVYKTEEIQHKGKEDFEKKKSLSTKKEVKSHIFHCLSLHFIYISVH